MVLHCRAGRDDQVLKAGLAARSQAQDLLGDIYASNLNAQLQVDAVFAIEALRIDSDLLFLFFPRQEAFRKRWPLVWDCVIGRNNREFSRLHSPLDHFFRRITGDHTSAENEVFRFRHVTPLSSMIQQTTIHDGARFQWTVTNSTRVRARGQRKRRNHSGRRNSTFRCRFSSRERPRSTRSSRTITWTPCCVT